VCACTNFNSSWIRIAIEARIGLQRSQRSWMDRDSGRSNGGFTFLNLSSLSARRLGRSSSSRKNREQQQFDQQSAAPTPSAFRSTSSTQAATSSSRRSTCYLASDRQFKSGLSPDNTFALHLQHQHLPRVSSSNPYVGSFRHAPQNLGLKALVW
jgi:hypothetical protein